MTRKEQIQDAAADHRDRVCCGFYDPVADARQASFVIGAEWSDEHPKQGLVSLDKAVKWLEEHQCDYPDYSGGCCFSILLKDFRKAMEE